MRTALLSLMLTVTTIVVTAQTRQITTNPYHSIRAYGQFRITLIEAEKERIEVDYNGTDPKDIEIRTSDGVVHMKFRNKHFWGDWNDSNVRSGHFAKVTFYFKKLDEISVQAGASIKSDNVISSPSLDLTCSMGSRMKLCVSTEELELDSSMGSDVELDGTTGTLAIYSKMGSSVKAGRLKSSKAKVSASMGSDVSVYASKELDASAGFGASVDFEGNPAVRNTSSSFGGRTNSTTR